MEIGSREGSVAGPLISHLASAVPRCPSQLGERPDLLHAVALRVARRGVACEFAHPKVSRKVILRGKDGEDADHYLEKQVKDAIRESKESS